MNKQMTDKEFTDDMRTYRLGHLPDGYPCVQTQQIDRLIEIIDRQAVESDVNAPWLSLAHIICSDAGILPGHIAHRLEMLRAINDTIVQRVADRCAEIAASQDAIGKTPAQVAAAIRREFKL